jgi:hypothetical protein
MGRRRYRFGADLAVDRADAAVAGSRLSALDSGL